MTTPMNPEFEALLGYLKEVRGFDFTGYKRSSLMRRVDRRMSQIGVVGYADYFDYLQVHPEEFTALFNTILINVTSFFRDPETWEHLRRELLPKMLADLGPEAPLRVWSAGCASGEEAYTIAMVVAEAIGPEAFRQRCKIYATDIDEEALAHARQAVYSERDLEKIPADLADKYFEPVPGGRTFRKDLRRSIIFGRNDLVQDAPISRVDLLVCRNTLMYLNAETQSRILTRFHFALAPGGLLFLGKAEMLLSHSSLFSAVDLKRRMFRKTPRAITNGIPPVLEAPVPPPPVVGLDRLRTEAFLTSPVAQVVVTVDGMVAMTNRQAEDLFGVSAKDQGRPFRDLDMSYRPLELRAYIEQAQVERRTVRVPDVEFTRSPSETVFLDVQVKPLIDANASLLGVALIFQDLTDARRLREDLEHANRQLETAYEELQSTNEELETTNEELQSTVEELETTNEELQSTNEELETMNEELQSTNDELQTINDELRVRTSELNDANAFLEAILTSLQAGVIVVDRQQHVVVWNRRAEDQWGLRKDEVIGQHLLNIDIGLPTDQLRPFIRTILSGTAQREQADVDAVNRRGRAVRIRVMITPLTGDANGVAGAILVMEPYEPPPAEPDAASS
jgi:two-component system, chemotaxis family, CheB/CheR fusion protein